MAQIKVPTRTRRAIARRLAATERKYGRDAVVAVVNRWLTEKREQAKIAREMRVIEERQRDLKARAARF